MKRKLFYDLNNGNRIESSLIKQKTYVESTQMSLTSLHWNIKRQLSKQTI